MTIVGIIALVLLIGWIGFIVYYFRTTFVNEKNKKRFEPGGLPGWTDQTAEDGRNFGDIFMEDFEWIKTLPREEHELKTFDGLTLRGSFFSAEPSSKARGTVVLVHGYRSVSYFDRPFYLRFYLENGFNVFVYDRRAHGVSDGRYITFGVLDRFDLRDWTNYLAAKMPDLPIILDGISMGGATVCMASSLEFPSNVKLIVADCPYANAGDQIRVTTKDRIGFVPRAAFAAISALIRIFAHCDINGVNAADEIKKCGIPFFLIHGDSDKFVPSYMGKQIFEACVSPKELLIVEEAGHASSYLLRTKKYQEILIRMINTYVCPENSIR